MGTELNPPSDWVAALQRQAQLEPAQAEAAVRASLRFLATRLPSPLFGAIQAQLAADGAVGDGALPPGGRR
jgi:hypothetical protein